MSGVAQMFQDERTRRLIVGQPESPRDAEIAQLKERIEALEKIVLGNQFKPTSIPLQGEAVYRIRALVAARYGLTVPQIMMESRKVRIVWPLFAGMYFTRLLLKKELEDIAQAYGKEEPGVARHAVAAVHNRREMERKFDAEMAELEAVLRKELGL